MDREGQIVMTPDDGGWPFRLKVGMVEEEPAVSVVIPAKNEARNLPKVFADLPRGLHEVILVDGGSLMTPSGWPNSCARTSPSSVSPAPARETRSACGFAVATGEFIVMLDADGSTDPAEIPRFVNALKDGADFAKGSRFMPGAGSSDISGMRRFGNYWLNKLVNLLFGTQYTDLCYGYNAFRRDCLSAIGLDGEETAANDSTMLWGDGFEVETLINVRIAKAGLRVTEVPSFERNRSYGTSNLNAFSDGIRILRTIRAETRRNWSPSRRTNRELWLPCPNPLVGPIKVEMVSRWPSSCRRTDLGLSLSRSFNRGVGSSHWITLRRHRHETKVDRSSKQGQAGSCYVQPRRRPARSRRKRIEEVTIPTIGSHRMSHLPSAAAATAAAAQIARRSELTRRLLFVRMTGPR